jgi:type I restriction enzyme S subunit
VSFPRYPAYKSSGVEWLGEVPEHWGVIAPKRLMKSCSGGTLIKGECADEPGENLYPAFSASGQDVWIEKPDYEESGLVLSAVGARCGKTFKADGKWGVVANTHCLFPTSSQVRDFFWYLTNREDWWEKGGTAQPFVKVKETLDRLWCLPPREEQEVIATFLDRETAKIDALIAEQQHLIELLQEKRQAVISHAATKGLNPNVPMKDSGVEWLGEVPEHWDVLPCRAFLNERDERNCDYRSDYYLSLVAGRGVIPYEEKGDIGNKKPEDLGKCKLVQEGDFVINSMNYGIGSYGVSRFNGVCSPVYIVATPSRKTALAGFSFRVLENKWFQQYAQSFGNGILAHRCAISWDILKNINAGMPPRDEQAEILGHLDRLTLKYQSLIAEAAKQVTLLQERRSALISAAVTGQIDVRGLVQEEGP